MRRALITTLTLFSFAAILIGSVAAQEAPSLGVSGEWREYGNDKGGLRFSPLTQLTPENVSSLQKAWVYNTEKGGPPAHGFQVTPLMVGDSLYLCTPYNHIISLDPETGEERWRFDPKNERIAPRSCRGVSYHRVADSEGFCAERIITATSDRRLLALDAATGQLCKSFGDGGAVDLSTGMGDVSKGYYYVTSAPTIVRGNIVLGGWVSDGQTVGEESGVIRAYNAVTGAFAWAWDLGRPGEHGEPGPGETYTRGTPNSWAPMSGDETLGLVYLPTGNATPDYWGGHRTKESDQYSTSVVALDAETGEVRWHFQTIHHDVWDLDVGSQPTLIDLVIDGETIPALIQPTKQGQVFLLDRRTGQPLAQVEEKPVPQGAAEGDWLSPTQPFSTGMPAFADEVLAEADMWGLTPFDQLWCRIKFRQARYDGIFTPPGVKPTITYPGYLGGMEWGGVSVDPTRGLMVVNWNRVSNYTRLIPRAVADAAGLAPAEDHISGMGEPVAQAGTPFAAATGGFLSPLGVPCTSPPYGLITAVDLNTREIFWTVPHRNMRANGPRGIPSMLPITMGVPTLGGSVTTGSGLIFIAASMERAMQAMDVETGKVLWKERLPFAGHATPMTYISPRSGRQFVVIAAGGHGAMGSQIGDSIVAFAVPED